METEYCLVKNWSDEKFVEGVNEKLKTGWSLHGTTMMPVIAGVTYYTQAFVKIDHKINESFARR